MTTAWSPIGTYRCANDYGCRASSARRASARIIGLIQSRAVASSVKT
jgi:hypothetical protein